MRLLATAVACALGTSPGFAGDSPETGAATGAALRLADDFELGTFAPQGGLYYKNNFEQSAGKVTFQSSDVRNGKSALKLSIEPICDQKHGHGCSERAEVWERSDVLADYDSVVWYGLSMKLVPPIPRDDHRYVMAQWKREILPDAAKDYSPFLAMRLDKGKLIFTVDTDSLHVEPLGSGERKTGCLPGETPVNDRKEDGQTRALVASQEDMANGDWRNVNGCTTDLEVIRHAPGLPGAESGWIDFAIMIHTGPTGDGRIEILANERWIATVKGHIGHRGKGLGKKQYFKFGPYRAANHGDWTVLYDRFRRGPACEDVTSPQACSVVEVAAR